MLALWFRFHGGTQDSGLDVPPSLAQVAAAVVPGFGKQLMIVGGILLLVGALITWWQPGRGGLPGDIFIRRPGFSFYFPVVTCLVLSLILSAVLRWLNR